MYLLCFYVGNYGDRCGRSVDAAGFFGFWYSLHAVNTRFVLEGIVCSGTYYVGYYVFVATQCIFAGVGDRKVPAARGAVSLVHTRQITGKQRCFVAAGASSNFDNKAFMRHRVMCITREVQPFNFIISLSFSLCLSNLFDSVSNMLY